VISSWKCRYAFPELEATIAGTDCRVADARKFGADNLTGVLRNADEIPG
jgi:hypothetical protein